jgi:hypothetical protein
LVAGIDGYSASLAPQQGSRISVHGRKVDRRMLGPAAGAAVMFDREVTMGLTIGEGIESAISARQLGFRPTWAVGSVGAISTFPVLPGIQGLTILAEADEASRRAVKACGSRWHNADREVIVVRPRSGSDINDAISGGAA